MHDEAIRIANVINGARSQPIATAGGASAGRRRLPLAVLPSNDRVTATLPREMRERFVAKLAPKISAAMTRDTAALPSDVPIDHTPLDVLLGAACATCRGDCCTGGTDHAHLDVDSLARMRVAHGWQTAEQVMEAYVAHLPRVHYRHSCVYHGVRGCALPRDMRADICNRHLCGALAQLTRAIDSGAEASFIAVAASPTAPRRVAIIGHGARCDYPLP